MRKKADPAQDKRAAREARRLEKAAALPPVPLAGGSYVVGPDGQLVREGVETHVKEA